MGETQHANLVTGKKLFMVYEAEWLPLRQCEGGGWYSETEAFGWTFRCRAKHKAVWMTTATGNTAPLQDLIARAADMLRQRHKVTA